MEEFEKYLSNEGNIYCRLCLKFLKEYNFFVSLQSTEFMENKSQEFRKLLPSTIFDDNSNYNVSISSYICGDCNETLNRIVKFLEMVSCSEQKLQQALNTYISQMGKHELEIEIKEEPDVHIEHGNMLVETNEQTFTTEMSVTDIMREFKKKTKPAVDITKYLFCEICHPKPNFSTFQEMSTHYETKHGQRGYAKCCSRKFLHKRTLIRHEEVHLNPLKYVCEICNKSCASPKQLRKHKLLLHSDESERKYECDFCGKKYAIKSNLSQHIRWSHIQNKEDRRKMACHVCGVELMSQHTLNRHLLSFHNIGECKWEICDKCGYKTRFKQDFIRHVQNSHTDNVVTPECNICGIKVKSIRRHMRLIHYAQPEKCIVCGHEFSNHVALKGHMKCHSDEKPYKCVDCGQDFKRKRTLDDHMSTHTGIPRYTCDYCDKTFNNSGNKSKHIKQAHPLERAADRSKKK